MGLESRHKMEVKMRRKKLTLDVDKWYASKGQEYFPPTQRATKPKAKVRLCLDHFATKPSGKSFCRYGSACRYAHDVANTFETKSQVKVLLQDRGWSLNEKRWKKFNSFAPETIINTNDIVVPPPPPPQCKTLCMYFFAIHGVCFGECDSSHNPREVAETKDEFNKRLRRIGLVLDEEKWNDAFHV